MDSMDQMADTLERIQTIRGGDVPADVRRYDFVYSYVQGGRRIDHVTPRPMTVSECNDYIERTHGIDLGKDARPRVEWGRGHIGNNGQAVIHPASNGAMFDHVRNLLEKIQAKQKQR